MKRFLRFPPPRPTQTRRLRVPGVGLRALSSKPAVDNSSASAYPQEQHRFDGSGSTPIPRVERTVPHPKDTDLSPANGVNRILGTESQKILNKKRQGYVRETKDQLIFIDGVNHAKPHTIMRFSNGSEGLVMTVNQKGCNVHMLDTNKPPPAAGNLVEINPLEIPRFLSTAIGPGVLGRVLNVHGEPIDDLGPLPKDTTRLKSLVDGKRQAPSWRAHERPSNLTRLHTGIKVVDSFFPVARGSRLGVTGPKSLGGMSELALDVVLSYQMQNARATNPTERMHVVYVLVGKPRQEKERILSLLRDNGAMEYTTVVVADERDSNIVQYYAPFAGATIADYLKWRKMHCTLVLDNMADHNRVAMRCFSYGRGLINYGNWAAEILERSGQLNQHYGGGSLTTIACCDTDDDREETLFYFLPHFQSTCDNYVELSPDMHDRGITPPISIFPVPFASPAYIKGPLRHYTGKLRQTIFEGLEIRRAANESESLGLELDWDVEEIIEHLGKIERLFSQNTATSLEETCVLTYLAQDRDFLQEIHPTQIHTFESTFLEWLDSVEDNPDVHRMVSLLRVQCASEKNEPFSDELEQVLNRTVAQFIEKHPELKQSPSLLTPMDFQF